MRKTRRWKAVVAIASSMALALACGTFGSSADVDDVRDGDAPETADPNEAGAALDGPAAPDAPTPCRGRPFGAPRLVMSIFSSQSSVRGADDYIYVSWDTSPDNTLALATRVGDTLVDAGAPAKISPVNQASPSNEDDPTVAPAGLLLVMSSDRPEGFLDGATSMPRLYLSRRSTTSQNWGLPVAITGGGSLGIAFLRPYFVGADVLYYVAKPSAALAEIRRARLELSNPPSLVDITVQRGGFFMGDEHPVVAADELEIFFASTRGNSLDVYTATRASPADDFGTPLAVTAVNDDSAIDYPTWLSPDGCELFLVSNRTGKREIYAASR
jgi:hypothetical protein